MYTSWMLEARESPPVRSLIFASRKGVVSPEFATYEMRNPKPGKGLGYFMA